MSKLIIPAFGSDSKWVGDALRAPATVEKMFGVPLDADAVEVFRRHNLPFVHFDEIIGEGRVRAARLQAKQLERNWYQTQRSVLTSLGACWPEIDRQAMHWFWQGFELSVAFASALEDMPKVQVFLREPANPRPGIFYLPSDVFWSVLTALLPREKCRYFGPSHQRPLPLRATEKPSNIVRKTRNMLTRWFNKPLPRNKIWPESSGLMHSIQSEVVFAINLAEIYRFRGIIRDLRQHVSVAIGLLGGNAEDVRRCEDLLRVPVFIPASTILDNDHSRPWREAVQACLDALNDENHQLAASALGYHFDYYCSTRWPALESAYSVWIKVFQKIRPSTIVISALLDAESQIPAVAAKSLGISSYAIPHGAVMRPDNFLGADYLCTSSRQMAEAFREQGLDQARIKMTSGLLLGNEYPERATGPTRSLSKTRVLILTELVGHPGCLAFYTRTSCQLESLMDIKVALDALHQHVEFSIKPHPLVSDMSLLSCAGQKIKEAVLPADSNLSELIENSDVVVSLNLYGSALVRVTQAGKPLILYWPDTESETYDYGHGFLSAGILATTANDLRNLLSHFVGSSEYRKELANLSLSFAEKAFTDQRYTSFASMLVSKVKLRPTSKSSEEFDMSKHNKL